MSLILRELAHQLNAPLLNNQSFRHNLGLEPNSSSILPLLSFLKPPSNISEKHEFEVSLDVQQFKPDELNVKVKGDWVEVEAKHEEKRDQHGFVSRQFTRRYKIPSSVDSASLQASLSSDGVLQLSAPRKNAKDVNIPIINVSATSVNGCEDANTETGKTNGASPTSSPVQPALKKPRIEVDN